MHGHSPLQRFQAVSVVVYRWSCGFLEFMEYNVPTWSTGERRVSSG